MSRLAIAAVLAMAACAGADERPANLDYITEAILAPTCGAATCHSSFRQEVGYAFDTVAGARNSFQNDPLLITSADESDPTSPPGLILNLKYELPGAPRMPYYEPIPDNDIDLIDRWLRNGGAGLCLGDAACLGNIVVPCKDFTDGQFTYRGTYDLEAIGTKPEAIDCDAKGAIDGKTYRCRNAGNGTTVTDCVEAP